MVLNGDGHVIESPESVPLSAVAGRCAGRQVTVLLPAQEIVCCIAQVPATSPARLRQMLPFSLEDDFACDIDQLHFAAGARSEGDAMAVSVIARDRLDAWIDALTNAAIEARGICSEADAVPDTPGSVTLFLEGRKILGRRPGGAPFCFEELTLSDLWGLLAAENDQSDDLRNVVLFIDRETREQRRDEIETWRQNAGEVNVMELADGCLPKLAAGLVFQSGTNLLQGDYAPRSNIRALARPWRAAASLAVFFLAFSVLGKGAEYFKLNSDRQQIDSEASAICAESYSSPQLSRCLVEMGRRLADYGQPISAGGEGFLTTLAAVAESLDSAMSIDGIGYRDGIMTLELITPNVGYLDNFDQRLTETGRFALDIQNTVPDSNGSLSSRVRIVSQTP